jgi:hypothetical protein
MCISTGIGGPQQPVLSVEHMVGCCHVCGYGCGDGFPNYAWGWLAGQKGKPYGARLALSCYSGLLLINHERVLRIL